MIDRQQIEQVRAAVDIVDLIREYVPSLKTQGRTAKGLCPFHSEKTPSFHVQADKGFFKCFGCGEGGDAIAFLAKVEQVGFSEALERLASRAGIVLKKSARAEEREPEGLQEKVRRALRAACEFYQDQLWSGRAGSPARDYLKERRITDDTATAFQLGVAPAGGDRAFEVLIKKGFSIEICQQAGLVVRSASGRFYDPMYGRLLFPIVDNFGHVVGFGGRVLPELRKQALVGDEASEGEPPKYLNSPETPVFSKGKTLYGLFQAKPQILAHRRVLILEGYMDVIGVHQAGFAFGVAALGTALTRDHARILKRYADEAVAFFDPDEAGERAAVRSLEPLLQMELFPRVVVTEVKEDPDDIILKKGKEYFAGLLEGAPDFVDYMLRRVSTGASMTIQQKAKAASQMLELVRHSPNAVLRSEWMKRISSALAVQMDSLEKELAKRPATAAGTALATAAPVVKRSSPSKGMPSIDEEYFRLMLTELGLWPETELSEELFAEEKHRRLFALLKTRWEESGKIVFAEIYDELPPEDRDWFVQLSMEDRSFSDPAALRSELVRGIKQRKDKARLNELGRRFSIGDMTPVMREEYRELLKRVKGSAGTPVPRDAM